MESMDREPSENRSITRLIHLLKANDSQAAAEIWQRFFQRLLPLARARLRGVSDRLVDEEDLLVSVFDRFYRAVQEERFSRVRDRDDLWQILLLLTEHRAADYHRKSRSAKRGGGRLGSLAPSSVEGEDVEQLADDLPTPEYAAAFNESLASALEKLTDDRQREIALLRLEGYENLEIANQLRISLSSVERKLRLIRECWSSVFPTET